MKNIGYHGFFLIACGCFSMVFGVLAALTIVGGLQQIVSQQGAVQFLSTIVLTVGVIVSPVSFLTCLLFVRRPEHRGRVFIAVQFLLSLLTTLIGTATISLG